MKLPGRRLFAAVLTVACVIVAVPPAVPSAWAIPKGVDFPIRHDFSLVPGLPGHGRNEPTSCYDSPDGKGYVCRIVAGHEQSGYILNFVIRPQDALDVGHDPKHGTSLVSREGYVYEGCMHDGNGDWTCDYRTRKQVSRDHYSSKGYVAQTFWKWKDYIKTQAGCAAAITGLWAKAPGKGFLFFLDECNNGPL